MRDFQAHREFKKATRPAEAGLVEGPAGHPLEIPAIKGDDESSIRTYAVFLWLRHIQPPETAYVLSI